MRISAGRPTPKQGTQKGSQNVSQNEPQNDSEMEPFWAPPKSKNHGNSLCFHSKRGPEGAPFLAKNEPRDEPKSGPILGQNGAEIHHFGRIFESETVILVAFWAKAQKGGLENFQKIF